ncbi:sigma-54 interaction domain-containing protein [Desulfitibacter alkalitolerans]|uniref:sigma-54 interaction domain-containing protein n=1 Tax=Desulfitibacter alkalitolerans TaxID=264641 RepID=UPI000483361D|nr:sigma 54-interacting transcriptional regulator [Desulfitibacter alkalitolerans]
MTNVLDFRNKEFFIFSQNLKFKEALAQVLIDPIKSYALCIEDGKVMAVYSTHKLMASFIMCSKINEHTEINQIATGEEFTVVNKKEVESKLSQLENGKLIVVVNEHQYPIGIIKKPEILKHYSELLQQLEQRNHFYQKIINSFEEEILITDKDGFVRFLNPESARVCGVKIEDVLNKHVAHLEQEKIISSSITMKVLSTKRKENSLQKLKNGTTVLATGVPVFDEDMNLVYVICTSKNVQEINKLHEEIAKKDNELKHKNQEIKMLRERIYIEDKFVCESEEMKHIKETIMKIAPTSVTVMVQGESGVGKEVITRLLHDLSHRNKYPLVKVNCGLIPENLLESELFGYESGAFTGANQKGKTGKFELAQKGTLFLDEIGEMSLGLQVKLLEFLQDREIIRVGGTKRIKIDTRVIVATNRDLKAMVKAKKFRQDLFYRLNVIPIKVPPLRERTADIIPLTEFFLNRLNKQYNTNKKLSFEVIQILHKYEWPGNVRELMHVLERLVLTSNSEIISDELISGVLTGEIMSKGRVICSGLFPLKEAKRDLEMQMVSTAYELYKSTYKAAKVLQIDQSTVVKILKKYKQ